MNKKTIISATDKTMRKLKILSKKKKKGVKGMMMVTVKKLSSKAKRLAVNKKGNDLYKNKKTVISATDNTILKLKVSANKKEGARGKLVEIAKKLATIAKEKESVRSKLAIIAKKLATTAKEKERTKNKLIVTAKQLAILAEEKEDVRGRLEITARKLATTAKEKESVRNKLVVTAKQLATTAEEKEDVRRKLAIIAKKLATTAKEKESVRSKLAVTAETLRLKAKQLAVLAKEKEVIRRKLEVTATKLAVTASERENVRDNLAITAKQLATTAEEKENVRSKLAITAEQLATIAEEKEGVRHKLAITAKQLATTAEEKEGVRHKLAITAKQLATTAEEKEDVRSKLAVTAKQLATTAEEKEDVRRKLAVTAKQLATTAEEKEDVRRKLAVIAKKLATTAKEKESVRRNLAVTAETLRLRAKELVLITAKEKAVLESIGDAVLACDKDGQVMLFNLAAEILTGFSAKEVIGKHYSSLIKFIKEKDSEPIDDFISESMKTGKKTSMAINTLLIKKDGSKISVADSANPIRYSNKKIIGCVVVFRDNSHEREMDKAKTEFVSLASHQLRTPLTSISWYTEMILNGDVGEVNPKQKKYLEEIYQGNKRMIDLVDVLLNVSRIEMGTFVSELEETNIVEIAKNVCDEQKFQIENKNLTLTENFSNDIPLFHTDKRFIRMIFQNLLSNSVKYTPQDGKIEFTISLDNQNILIKISDNGYGIPKNQQGKIFTKLFRADNALDKDPSGTGLGLYIVKSIVEKFDGKIWFESEENIGTTFYISIPLIGAGGGNSL